MTANTRPGSGDGAYVPPARRVEASAGHRRGAAALRGYKRRRADNGQRNQKEAPPVTIEALRAMVAARDLATARGCGIGCYSCSAWR